MRDIKEIRFRVWVKFLQEMQNVQCLNMGSSVITDGYDYPIEADAVYLMQYTGVKDANAVDIYEGDVVECSRGAGVISWAKDFCGFSLSIKTKHSLLEVSMSSPTVTPCKVIGNIYANPELTKQGE